MFYIRDFIRLRSLTMNATTLFKNCGTFRYNRKFICARLSATLCRQSAQTRNLRQNFTQFFKRHKSVKTLNDKGPENLSRRTYEVKRLFSLAKPEKIKLTGMSKVPKYSLKCIWCIYSQGLYITVYTPKPSVHVHYWVCLP